MPARSTCRASTALLLIGVMLLVLLFRTSSGLAGLRHRGLHDHGGRRHHGLRRDLETVELAVALPPAAVIVPFVVID